MQTYLTECNLRDIEQARALLARVSHSVETHRARINREEQEAKAALREQNTGPIDEFEEHL
jgi:hypothetical protein